MSLVFLGAAWLLFVMLCFLSMSIGGSHDEAC